MQKTLEEHWAIPRIAEDLAEIEAHVSKPSLADAIRAGAKRTPKAETWVEDDGAVCALSAAALAVKAMQV